MKRIIVSDIHLGSKYSREEAFLSFLKNIEYDELILAGDIIDFIKVPSFSKRIMEIVNSIDFSKKIYYIVGNHDVSLKEFVGTECFGIQFVSEVCFVDSGQKIRVEHGDKYDGSSVKHSLFMNVVSVVHNILEVSLGLNLTEWWTEWETKKRRAKSLWDIMLKNFDYDYIIMGHYHCPEKITWEDFSGKKVTYVNSGDWVTHQTFVEVENGIVSLKSYKF